MIKAGSKTATPFKESNHKIPLIEKNDPMTFIKEIKIPIASPIPPNNSIQKRQSLLEDSINLYLLFLIRTINYRNYTLYSFESQV
jgi:hypothetical protein